MLVLKIAAGIILAVILLAVGCSVLVSSSVDDEAIEFETTENVQTEEVAEEEEVAAEEEVPGETAGQRNARRSVVSYLNTGAFSRKGLITQLEFEGYSTADATYAVDAVSPDWNAQAAKSAKNYLEISGFSRSGLIQQLEFEGFTRQEAEYGVNEAGL